MFVYSKFPYRGWTPLEFFTISPQYRNAIITNFILALPFKIIKTNNLLKSLTLKCSPFYQLTSNFTFTNNIFEIQITKEIANIWEYKVNAIIANFVCLWKCRMITRNFQLYPSEACVNLVVNIIPGHKTFCNEGDINF